MAIVGGLAEELPLGSAITSAICVLQASPHRGIEISSILYCGQVSLAFGYAANA